MSTLRSKNTSVNPKASNSPKPPSGITWGGEILSDSIRSHKNIDTIHYGLFVAWHDERFLLQLENLKDQARRNDFNPVPFKVPGVNMELAVSPYAKKGGYAFTLISADVFMFFSRHAPGGNTPNVFVEVGSVSCWLSGVQSVVKNVNSLIEFFGGRVLNESINRVDLAVDFVGLDLRTVPVANLHQWIKQARKANLYYEGLLLSGIDFGRGGAVSLRIYDKVLEVKNTPVKQAVISEVCEVLDYDDEPITRVEFQLRKEVLRDFKIKTFNQLKGKMASLWSYCTEKWCRLALADVDRNNTEKSTLHPFWVTVIEITWSGVRFVKRGKEIARKSLENLIKQAAGIAKTTAAILYKQGSDIDGIIYSFQALIENELRLQYNTNFNKFIDDYWVRLSQCWVSV